MVATFKEDRSDRLYRASWLQEQIKPMPAGTIHRCHWAAQSDPLMQTYHDEEWGVPEHDSRALWEKLILDGFQAGLSWSIILRKRAAFRQAFRQFDPVRVARFGERDIVRLLADSAIVRSRAKIEAAIGGARAFLAMQAAGEDFAHFIWSFTGGQPIQGSGRIRTQTPLSLQLSRALKQRGFKFVGPVIVHAWMQAVGLVNDHAPGCFRRRPVAALARGRRARRL